MVDSPSGGAPAKAPRWDLVDAEGYGGGNCVSVAPWMFSGYVGIYRRKKYVGGRPRGPRDRGRAQGVGAPSTLVGTWLLPLLCSQCQIKGVQKVVFSKFIHLMLIKRNPLTRLIGSC